MSYAAKPGMSEACAYIYIYILRSVYIKYSSSSSKYQSAAVVHVQSAHFQPQKCTYFLYTTLTTCMLRCLYTRVQRIANCGHSSIEVHQSDSNNSACAQGSPWSRDLDAVCKSIVLRCTYQTWYLVVLIPKIVTWHYLRYAGSQDYMLTFCDYEYC